MRRRKILIILVSAKRSQKTSHKMKHVSLCDVLSFATASRHSFDTRSKSRWIPYGHWLKGNISHCRWIFMVNTLRLYGNREINFHLKFTRN